MPTPSKQVRQLRTQLRALATPEKAKVSAWFFKTGPGEYAEGDKFIGITVPELRKIARGAKESTREDALTLLVSPIHEERLLALYLLIQQFEQGSPEVQKQVYTEYLAHTKYINNWDLVDSSAYHIVGSFLAEQPTTTVRKTLLQLAHSPLLWERRIAMVATFHWIKQSQPDHTLLIAKTLLTDKHDLIQKAVGWMLREVGKRCSKETLEVFLEKYSQEMGRTALRYAIEHFPKETRKAYLTRRSLFSTPSQPPQK